MDWIEVTVHTTTEGSEIVSQALIDAGAGGTSIEDRNDVQLNQRPEGQWDILDESIALRMSEDVLVHAYYAMDEYCAARIAQVDARLAELKAMDLGFSLGALTRDTLTVNEEDWAEYWKKQFTPFRLGRHMVVRPSWESYPAQPGDKVIEIDPGMAFGTGTHETTAMCVELVEQYVQPGQSVIDVGTGTGILAIAAALSGAQDILAIDLDPVAVRVCAENVRVNGLEGVIRVRQGDLLEAVDEVADLVIANIIADVIIAFAAPVRAHIRPGGRFICSGIAREKQQAVLDALEAAGYRQLDVRNQGEWTAICCVR